MNGGVKRCSRCKESLPRTAFATEPMQDGLRAYCREYSAEYYRRRQEANGKAVRVKVPVPEGHERCPHRGVIKPHDEWHRNTTASDGLATRCKRCKVTQGRAGHLKRQYGMTEAERDELIASQKGLCVIRPSAPAAHVDHCHNTGRVRGVLCFNCNSAIGKLGDDPATVRRAAAYLEGKSWKPTLVAPGVYLLPS